MPKSESKTKNVYLPPTRVREDLRDQLRNEAERKQTSVSALIREAIIAFLPSGVDAMKKPPPVLDKIVDRELTI